MARIDRRVSPNQLDLWTVAELRGGQRSAGQAYSRRAGGLSPVDIRVQALLAGGWLVASLVCTRKIAKKVMRMVKNLRNAALPAALITHGALVSVTAAPG